MAVTSTTPSIQYTANGSTTEFAFTFVVPASDSGGTISSSTGSISSSSNSLTVTDSNFFYTNDLQGKAITIAGAGSGSATLETTITTVNSATNVTLGTTASTTVSGQNVVVTTGTYATTLNNNSDIQVFVNGVQKTIGAGNDYTVLLNVGDDANKAGKVIFNSAPTDTHIVTIKRDVTLARTTDFQTGGALTAKTLNSEFDTMIMAIQDTQYDTTAGAVKFPEDETPTSSFLPAVSTRRHKLLAFDSAGEFSMKDDISTGNFAITGTTVRGTTALKTPMLQSTSANDALGITSDGHLTVSQSLTAGTVDINGGAIDGTTIGASTPSTGVFTTLQTSGNTVINGLTYPSSDGSAGYVLKTDGSGALAFDSVAGLSLFTALTDTPANYTGHANKYLKINGAENGIGFDALQTSEVTEDTNLYYTDARVDSRITSTWFVDEDNMSSNSATKFPTQQSVKAYVDSQILSKDNSDEITEGSSNLYFTDARARGAVSVTDSGGDGSLAYNNSTGVFTYTGPSASEVRAHITGTSPVSISSGAISVADASATDKGIAAFHNTNFTVSSGTVSIKTDGVDNTHLDFGTTGNKISTDDIPEGSNNKFFTTNGGALNADSLPEGSTNLYFTTARADARIANASITALSDTPASLSGMGGKFLKVNAGANAIDFVTHTFIQSVLEDTTPELGGNLNVNDKIIENTTTNNGHIKFKPDQTSATGNYGHAGGWGWAGGTTHFNGPLSITEDDTPDIGEIYNQGIQITATGDSFPAVVLQAKSDNDRFGNIWFLRSGSDSGDARVSDGNTLGGFYASGFAAAGSGQNYNTVSSACYFVAAGDHSDSNSGGYFQVRSTNEGSTSQRTIVDFKGNRAHFNPSNENVDFRVDGDTNDNIFFVDAGNERVGVKTSSPDTDFHVAGTFKADTLDSSFVLSKIHNVHTATPTDGQFLKYVNANSRWEPATIGYVATQAADQITNGFMIKDTLNATVGSGWTGANNTGSDGATGVDSTNSTNMGLFLDGGTVQFEDDGGVTRTMQKDINMYGASMFLKLGSADSSYTATESEVIFGHSIVTDDFGNEYMSDYQHQYPQNSNRFKRRYNYPTMLFSSAKHPSNTKFGGFISTINGHPSGGQTTGCADMYIGAYPVSLGVTDSAANMDALNTGKVSIIVGGKSAQTFSTYGGSTDYKYRIKEVVKYDMPTTGTVAGGNLVEQGARATFLEPFVLANKTTTERNTYGAAEGMTIWNTTTDQLEIYNGSSWGPLGSTTINNNADNRVITGSGTSNTLEGEANLTFDGSKLDITNSGSGDSFTVTNSSGAMANDAAAVKINVTDTSDTDNWYALHILNNGTSKFSITGSGLTTINYLAQNSDVQTNNARQLTTSSDMRLKNDKGLLTDATTKIKQLKPRYFKWKDDVEKNGEDNALQQLGFFSQEVNPIIPEAACKVALKDEDGNAILDSEGNQDYSWGLNTRAIVATLVKTVQELEARIKTLEDNQ